MTTTADAFAAAVLAEVALPPVLAYAGATALVGLAAAPPVLAEAAHSPPSRDPSRDAYTPVSTHSSYFESREPGEVPHWVKKDSTSTLMDLHEKMACVSGILADVTLNPNL